MQLGEEHLRTGRPILYTSADSVMQIAAHEERFGLDRLDAVCRTARAVLDERGIIAPLREFLTRVRAAGGRSASSRGRQQRSESPLLPRRRNRSRPCVHDRRARK